VSNAAAETFRRAARLNAGDGRLRGCVTYLEDDCDVIVTGDLHGNRGALARIAGYADLAGDPRRRLILQEIIHGPVDAKTGYDRSIEVLLRSARLKIAHPQQVLFVLGNHDVAEITGNEITRNGQPSCKTFAAGLAYTFADAAGEVRAAMEEFILSLPLAVRCPNSVLISHSLPSAKGMSDECFHLLERRYSVEDFRRGKCVYEWTWGRGHLAEQVEQLARGLAVEFFIMGHLHSPGGYERIAPRAIALASDHECGCIMQFSSSSALTVDNAESAIKRMAALGA
jgi:hypothetical protein